MTREPAGYGSPGAFRRALTDRLRAIAAEGPWALPHLQRQFAYDRLLERLYAVDDGWIVKGPRHSWLVTSACGRRSMSTCTGRVPAR